MLTIYHRHRAGAGSRITKKIVRIGSEDGHVDLRVDIILQPSFYAAFSCINERRSLLVRGAKILPEVFICD
jgi:hypothetical protein